MSAYWDWDSPQVIALSVCFSCHMTPQVPFSSNRLNFFSSGIVNFGKVNPSMENFVISQYFNHAQLNFNTTEKGKKSDILGQI